MVTEADFEALLKQHIGLDAASVGPGLIERAVQERQRSCRLDSRDAYLQRVVHSPGELQELVEAVVVPETWFFRDRGAFEALALEMGERWRREPTRPLHLLSLPCATGEEPFSMAMMLLDTGLSEGNFRIDAVDISERALERARRGEYGNNSFRGAELGFRDRHFERTNTGYRVAERVRKAVHCRQGNLLSASAILEAQSYDAIFCRNVLIYLDREAQCRAQQVLSSLLRETGQLFVGPAETSLLSNQLFISTRVPMAFGFRKVGPDQRAPTPGLMMGTPRPPPPPHAAAQRSRSTHEAAPARHPSSALATPVRPIPTSQTPTAATHLQRAAELADRGRLSDASRLCAEHLRNYGPSANLFYLMALLREASQELHEAVSLHKKALYLDPNHHEALIHLALLLEKQGDLDGARRLRRRASRPARNEDR